MFKICTTFLLLSALSVGIAQAAPKDCHVFLAESQQQQIPLKAKELLEFLKTSEVDAGYRRVDVDFIQKLSEEFGPTIRQFSETMNQVRETLPKEEDASTKQVQKAHETATKDLEKLIEIANQNTRSAWMRVFTEKKISKLETSVQHNTWVLQQNISGLEARNVRLTQAGESITRALEKIAFDIEVMKVLREEFEQAFRPQPGDSQAAIELRKQNHKAILDHLTQSIDSNLLNFYTVGSLIVERIDNDITQNLNLVRHGKTLLEQTLPAASGLTKRALQLHPQQKPPNFTSRIKRNLITRKRVKVALVSLAMVGAAGGAVEGFQALSHHHDVQRAEAKQIKEAQEAAERNQAEQSFRKLIAGHSGSMSVSDRITQLEKLSSNPEVTAALAKIKNQTVEKNLGVKVVWDLVKQKTSFSDADLFLFLAQTGLTPYSSSEGSMVNNSFVDSYKSKMNSYAKDPESVRYTPDTYGMTLFTIVSHLDRSVLDQNAKADLEAFITKSVSVYTSETKESFKGHFTSYVLGHSLLFLKDPQAYKAHVASIKAEDEKRMALEKLQEEQNQANEKAQAVELKAKHKVQYEKALKLGLKPSNSDLVQLLSYAEGAKLPDIPFFKKVIGIVEGSEMLTEGDIRLLVDSLALTDTAFANDKNKFFSGQINSKSGVLLLALEKVNIGAVDTTSRKKLFQDLINSLKENNNYARQVNYGAHNEEYLGTIMERVTTHFLNLEKDHQTRQSAN